MESKYLQLENNIGMEAAEEIASILKSSLSREEKSMLLRAYCDDDILSAHTASSQLYLHQDRTEQKEGSDVISKREDDQSPISLSSSQESKGKGGLDPSIIEEILPIWNSDLPWDEKSSISIAILLDKYNISTSEDIMTTTSLEVKLSQKAEDSKEKTNGVQDKSHSDETSKKIDEPSSFHSPNQEAKAIEASPLKLNLNLKEKLANNGTHDQKNSPPPEQATVSTITSSKTKLGEISQLRDAKESRQVAPADSSLITFVESEFFQVIELNSTDCDGKEQVPSRIHKQGTACKHCNKLILCEESAISLAKCGCSSTLIHNQCANAWSHEKGNKCSHCEKDILNNEVKLSLIPPQTIADNSQIPSVAKRYWCCFS